MQLKRRENKHKMDYVDLLKCGMQAYYKCKRFIQSRNGFHTYMYNLIGLTILQLLRECSEPLLVVREPFIVWHLHVMCSSLHYIELYRAVIIAAKLQSIQSRGSNAVLRSLLYQKVGYMQSLLSIFNIQSLSCPKHELKLHIWNTFVSETTCGGH